ncbi:MAG: GTP-binding protein [Candidatus Heimdallarchaeota archaeon]|nr:GTP-binding protein [Candidatus Heimdallarchaeota archaeon]
MTDRTLHKVAILGTPRSGKTTFCVRLAKGLFAENIPTTRGLDFHVVTADLEGLKLQIWDMAGQNHFREAGVFDGMVSGASAFLFCYDASDPSSIREIDNWLEIAKQHEHFEKTQKYLVGLKADLISESSMIGLNNLVTKHVDNQILTNHFILSTKSEINLDSFLATLAEDLTKITRG